MKDELGSRMKENYEDRTRIYLPRRTYTIIRIDGKGFHSFTKEFKRPYDMNLALMMDYSAQKLVKEIQGAKFAYVQSDEVSILCTDFDDIRTEAWFDGNIQKITSVSASLFGKYFNKLYMEYKFEETDIRPEDIDFASFDSRVFTIPDAIEVENYFIWRQQDAIRNSVQMMARSLYSHKECMNKNSSDLHEMIFQKGVNWAKQNEGFKNGRVMNKLYSSTPSPVFTQEREFLKGLINGK